MLFAKILFTRTLSEISGRGLLRDERFGFRPKHNAVLLLARLVERVSRDFGEKRVTGAVFLDVAKTFSVAWVDGLLYKLTVLNFPSYLVKIISSYLYGQTFEVSFQSATSTHRGMRAGTAQDAIISPMLFSVYQHTFAIPPHQVGSVCGEHGFHSHIPPASTACHLSGVISQWPRAVTERIEDHCQGLEEYRNALRKNW